MNITEATPPSQMNTNKTNSFLSILIYISVILTLKALIFVYWFFSECKAGKVVAEQIVANELQNINQKTNEQDKIVDNSTLSNDYIAET